MLIQNLIFSRRSPATLANVLGLDLLLKDGYSNVTANLRFFNSVSPRKTSSCLKNFTF